MTRKHSPARLLILSCVAIFLCIGFVTVCAQELPPTPAVSSSAVRATQMQGARVAMLKSPAKRSSNNRRLVKIRTRAGDTLSLLGDRFGVPAKEIATLNGIAISTQLQTNRELLIPLPTPEMLSKEVADKLVQHNSNLSGANAVASVEADGGWENVQGVLFRKGSAARTNIVANQTSTDESNRNSNEAKDASLTKIVEVSEAERSNVAQPVWIYLVGGARVEADSVNETAEGVWYTHGNLFIFIERSRIERIERERVKSVSESSDSWTERGWTTGNLKFDALIKENGLRYGVDPYLIFCVMEQESQFKPRIVSPKGARGLMQLMPGTAARFGVRKPFEPAENIMGGTRYLKQLLENFGGRVDLVLAGYNAGEGAVMKFGGNVPPYRETRNYVQRISKRYGQSKSFVAPVTETPAAAARLK
jgi:LysM repeat protein